MTKRTKTVVHFLPPQGSLLAKRRTACRAVLHGVGADGWLISNVKKHVTCKQCRATNAFQESLLP